MTATTGGRGLAAVLWDMDGTLVDTEPYWIECEYELVEAFGGTWSDEHAHAIVGSDLLDSARYISEHGGVPLAPRQIVERLLDGVVERIRQRVPWRPGARELLAALREDGVPCALVTMSWSRFADPVVAELPAGSFDVVVTGDTVTHGKPHPDPYLKAARELGVDPARCVAIEDSPTGVRSAVDAGCRVLGVPNVRELEAGPRVVLADSLADVRVEDLRSLATGRGFPARASLLRRPAWLPRRALLGATVAVVLASATGVALALQGEDPPSGPPPAVPLDAWAPSWTLDATLPVAEARLRSMREVSPFWFSSTGATAVGPDAEVPVEAAERFLDEARDAGALVVPSVRDAMPAGGMAGVLADPAQRAAHVDTLVAFVLDGDFDGLDLDYEQFAFADGRDSWEATRPNWLAFLEELAAQLHLEGRTLTVSVPPVYDGGRTGDSGFWVYDHGAMAEIVDRIRIMGYDFSTGEAGPIAPLDWVRSAVEGTAGVVEDDSKLVLGVPVYGYNWPVSATGTCPPTAEGRTGVTSRNVADLAARRGGTPVYDAAIGEWSFTYQLVVDDGTTSCTQTREVRWVDGEGALARIAIAREARLGGVALWALGYESDAAWSLIDGEIHRADPASSTTVLAD